jgi:hypothetical protein
MVVLKKTAVCNENPASVKKSRKVWKRACPLPHCSALALYNLKIASLKTA